jgi:hypothetical protein
MTKPLIIAVLLTFTALASHARDTADKPTAEGKALTTEQKNALVKECFRKRTKEACDGTKVPARKPVVN